MTLAIRRTLLATALVAAAVAAVYTPSVSAETTETSCVTADADLLATVEAKVERHKTTGRTDLVETFGRAHRTMLGQDSYTVSDLKARPDRQTPNWQGNGPNALWQSVYTELDRLEGCRAAAEAPTPPTAPTPQDDPPPPAADDEGAPQGSASDFTLPPPPPEEDTLLTTTQDSCADPCVSISGGYVSNGFVNFYLSYTGSAPSHPVIVGVSGARIPRAISSGRDGSWKMVYMERNPQRFAVQSGGGTVTATIWNHRTYNVSSTNNRASTSNPVPPPDTSQPGARAETPATMCDGRSPVYDGLNRAATITRMKSFGCNAAIFLPAS
ncbi:MAG: hypothetical protein OXG47_10490 [bacterium]|nr:hypothetical protein [bacterium]